jgi:Neuraminidase (sialidase)
MPIPVTLGTSTYAQATAYSGQHKIVKSSNGTLLAFAMTTNLVISYKTSIDNGLTWDAAWTTAYTASHAIGFLIFI